MRRRGKGNKPRDDGGKTTDPKVLNENGDMSDGLEEDDIDIEIDEDEDLQADPKPIYLKSRVPAAYAVLKDILAERRGNWFSGFLRNVRRNKTRGARLTISTLLSVAAGGVVAALTGDPTAAIAAAAAGMTAPSVASTAHVRMSRLDLQRRDYPDTPEFRDDWVVSSYELMRMINGFNLRVEAIARLRRLSGEIDDPRRSDTLMATADDFADLLDAWRQELVETAELLGKYETDDMDSVLTDVQTIATIRILNPLKDGRYDWLSLDPEIIPPGHEQELLERDIREINCHQDVADAIDPYEALRREREKAGEPID